LILNYKNVELKIYVNGKVYEYDINENIEVVRDEFNASISRLSEQHNSLDYWLMRISERNTLVNHLFLDICRIELIEKLLNGDQNISVSTNNMAIYIHFKNRSLIKIKDNLIFILWST